MKEENSGLGGDQNRTGESICKKILKIQRTAKEMGKGKYILQTVVSTIV